VPGIRFGGLFRNLTRLVDKLAIVRSFAHTQADQPRAGPDDAARAEGAGGGKARAAEQTDDDDD